LNSATDAAQTRYAPLATLVVAAGFATLAFLPALGGFGLIAWRSGKPLTEFWILLLAVLGFVFSFLGLRQVRTSEGAKSGAQYATITWWICLVGGLCYTASMFGVDWLNRSEAEKQLTQFASVYVLADAANTDDANLKKSFFATIDPNNVKSVEGNPKLLEVQFALPMALLRNSNLLMIASRNGGQFSVVSTGLKSTETKDDATVTVAEGLLKCPEGEFPITIPLRVTISDTKKKLYQIMTIDGLVPTDEKTRRAKGIRTPYGWQIYALENQAQLTTEAMLEALTGYYIKQPLVRSDRQYSLPQATAHGIVKRFFLGVPPDSPTPVAVGLTTMGRHAVMGGLGVLSGDPAPLPESFFTREDGKPLNAEQLATFQLIWNDPRTSNIAPAGRGPKSPSTPVRNARIEFRENAISIFVPFEASPQVKPFTQGQKVYTTCWAHFVCDDAATLAELTKLRTAGGPLTLAPATPLDTRYPLRLVGFRSNFSPFDASGGKMETTMGSAPPPPGPR